MTETRKWVRIFLASPGDLIEERKTAKAVVDELNHLFGETSGYQVELIGWEDTVTGVGRPQALINRDLARCELFIGMIWKRWGTPPDRDGKYTSGFEEEYRTSIERRKSAGRPEISLFLKDIEEIFLRDPGEDLRKVLAFRDELKGSKEILFETFADSRDFEGKVRRCIVRYLQNLQLRDTREPPGKRATPESEEDSSKPSTAQSAPHESMFSAAGASFLRSVVARTATKSGQEAITAAEIARVRLLATIIGRHGNDDETLGVHDANLLFAERARVEFGRSEMHGLLAAGLARHNSENVPLWHWIAALDGFSIPLLPIYSLASNDVDEAVGALRIMRLTALPLPSHRALNRDFLLRSWFGEEAPNEIKVAALNYLGQQGVSEDLAPIRKEFERNDSNTVSAAAEALVRISARDSREKALLALYDLQVAHVDRGLLKTVFESGEQFSTQMLLNGVTHRNTHIRRLVVALLVERDELPADTAEQLLSDSDVRIRFDALNSLVEAGQVFSDDGVRAILFKSNPRVGLSTLTKRDPKAQEYWERFQQQRLRSLSERELQEIAQQSTPLMGDEAQFVLAERKFTRSAQRLRQAIRDRYKTEFERALARLVSKYPSDGDLIESVKRLEDHTRNNWTRQALDILSRRAARADLPLMRTALSNDVITFSRDDLQYFEKNGEWQDVPLVIQLLERPAVGLGATILRASDDARYDAAAVTLYHLARNRVDELLQVPMPSALLARVIVRITDNVLRRLDDKTLTALFSHEADPVRKAASLKSVIALPKSRVKKLLIDYQAHGEQRYYNVIHWLDLAVSTPKATAVRVARTAIRDTWVSSRSNH
jgi:hypothetical protein